MVGIYRIRNLINNHSYYGSSKTIEKRWRDHKSRLNLTKHDNVILQKAWNKYSELSFIFEVVELVPTNSSIVLLEIEQIYIDDKNPYYNINKSTGGGDTFTNDPNKEERRQKIKAAVTERYDNWSSEIKDKFHCSKGIPKSQEFKDHLSKLHKENYKNVIYKSVNIDGTIYPNQTAAARSLGISIELLKYRVESKSSKFENYNYVGEQKQCYTKEEVRSTHGSNSKSWREKMCKPFFIDNVEYETVKLASIALNLPVSSINYRLKSESIKYQNYYYK